MIHSDVTATPADTLLFQSPHTINPFIDAIIDGHPLSQKLKCVQLAHVVRFVDCFSQPTLVGHFFVALMISWLQGFHIRC